MSTSGRAAAAAVRALALLVVASAAPDASGPALAQVQVPIEVDQPLPNVGDQVRLRTEVLQTAPYNQDPGRYAVVFFGCVGTAEQCRDRRRWQRLTMRDERGLPVQPPRPYACTSGACEMVVRLQEPRETTIHFRAVVHDLNDQGNDLSPPLAVRWVPPPAPQRPPAAAAPSLTITVNGASCTAIFQIDPRTGGLSSDRCELRPPHGARIPMSANAPAPAPSLSARLDGFPDSWSLRYYWAGNPGGAAIACGNPCAPGPVAPLAGTFPQPPPAVPLQVEAFWQQTGERGRNPQTGAAFDALTAIVWVEYVLQ